MTSTPDQSQPGNGSEPQTPYGVGQHGQTSRPPSTNPNTSLIWGHLLNLVSVIGPLVYWLATREISEAHDREGKEALNWGITVTIASIACGVLYIIPIIGGMIGGILLSAVWLINVIFAIYATIETSNKGGYRYPFTLNLVQ